MKILSLFMCLCVSLGSNYVSFDRHDAADKCFLSFIETEVSAPVQYTRTPLYNFDLEESGWQYTFTAGDQYGYALIVELIYGENHWYEIEEVYFNKQSVFDAVDIPVYVTFHTYLEYKNGAFYDIESGIALTDSMIAEVESLGFCYRTNDYGYDYVTETINYTSKTEVDKGGFTYGMPAYDSPESNTSCANIAGSVIIGYLDTINENLIPNFVTYRQIGDKRFYKGAVAEINAVTLELKTLMGTDANGGTTYSGFVDGMARYAQNRGTSFTFTSVMSGGAFDYAKYKTQIDMGKPVALFLSGFSIVSYGGINEGNGQDSIGMSNYPTATHVLVGYGYKRVQYFSGNTMVKDLCLLQASTGLALNNLAYLNVGAIGHIDRADAIMVA
ncbi:MAG: hypothetical protein HFK10_08890 [Clostridia bacterium]|nr:hypothetical protein [Clostridia bacterium]